MVQAYILINCNSGMAGKAAKKMSKLAGVRQVHVVTGLHDIVALVESRDLTSLASSIVGKIQKVEGVGKTVTMICVQV